MTKATGPLYAVHFKRRRIYRTDYSKRLALLKSGLVRLVVRKSNSSVQAQFVEFAMQGDKVVACGSSRDLTAFGFPGKCNTPSAYLVGFLVGKKAVKAGVKEFVLDIGLHSATKGSLVFAVLKGAVDAGLKATYGEDKLPSKERIAGKHLGEKVQVGFSTALEKINSTGSALGKVRAPPQSAQV